MNKTQPIHPLGTEAKILLSSVFGPYAQDDEYGSRLVNPMELYHNQVTRVQGIFSLRMFHPSLGMKMIQENVDAPCTHLDFPTLDRFIDEIKNNDYDIIGIGAIIPNIGKVKKMCELIREYLPNATIVIGGHVANVADIKKIVDVDHVAQGEGVHWFRKFLGQDTNAPINHPITASGFGSRIIGLTLPDKGMAGVLIPSVGCPMGCNFCSTSALFGGKGNFIHFFETGDELYEELCKMEKELQVSSFFIMDENFLFHKKRALRLLELIEENNKSWSFNVFTSARIAKKYTDEQLVALGISWIWMGLEGEGSQYTKLDGVDTRELIKHLQSLGIKVLGSTIIGLENHTPENIDEIIDWGVQHNTDFHQFMLYFPIHGTPLFEQMKKEGRMMPEDECAVADTHGQCKFNFYHEHIKDGQEREYLLNAFTRDFEVNGPSLLRLIRTMLGGWKNYKNHPNMRIRNRYIMESQKLKFIYSSALWAMKKWYRKDKEMQGKIDLVLQELYEEFGLKTRILSPIIGSWLYVKMIREDRRLKSGWTYEPRTLYKKKCPCAGT